MIRLAVRSPADRADLVLAALLDLAPAGVEQVDRGEVVEFAIYGAPGELPDLGAERATVGGIAVDVHSAEVGDDWAERWKEFHRPVEIGGRVCVRPPWCDPAAGLEDIVIDPGRAFGTAAHPTTRLCAELLLEAEEAGEAHGMLADLGTGSGVLAILAAKLGWQVIAADHEPAAVEAAARNAAANDVEFEIRRIDLRRERPPRASSVVANLTAELLGVLAAGYASRGDAPSMLICSGLLAERADSVIAAFEGCGLKVERRSDESGWVGLRLGD